MSLVFRNVLPMEEALELIDKERHPRLHRYALATVSKDKKTKAAPFRLACWVAGYKRFGDQFEETLNTYGRRFRRPNSLANALEENLPDRWMLVGKLRSEMPEGIQLIQSALTSHREPFPALLATMYLNKKVWNPEHDKVISWIPQKELRGSVRSRTKWSESVSIFPLQSESWTLDEALLVVDTIPYDEAKELHKVDALKDPRKMLLHYTEGMPVEFLAAM